MDLSKFAEEAPYARHDGWSRERKVRFLDHLSVKGNVRNACAIVGMSREAAYRLRRRDPLFARGWSAALALARANGTEVLACRAIDGIEEDIWYRGELVGKRVRHDARLLLAHLGRLDRLVDEKQTGKDMGRFDELLAAIAGESPPDVFAAENDPLPLERNRAVAEAAQAARIALLHSDDPVDGFDGEDAAGCDEDQFEALMDACEAEGRAAGRDAAVQWDEWFRHACTRVDEVLAAPEIDPRTVSDLSTSPAPEVASASSLD